MEFDARSGHLPLGLRLRWWQFNEHEWHGDARDLFGYLEHGHCRAGREGGFLHDVRELAWRLAQPGQSDARGSGDANDGTDVLVGGASALVLSSYGVG